MAGPRIPSLEEVHDGLLAERDYLSTIPKRHLKHLLALLELYEYNRLLAANDVVAGESDSILYNAGYARGMIEALRSLSGPIRSMIDGQYHRSDGKEQQDGD